MEKSEALTEAANIAKTIIKKCESKNVSTPMLEVAVALLVNVIKSASDDAGRFANLITMSLENDEFITIHCKTTSL